jgi:hypothetical protein
MTFFLIILIIAGLSIVVIGEKTTVPAGVDALYYD